MCSCDAMFRYTLSLGPGKKKRILKKYITQNPLRLTCYRLDSIFVLFLLFVLRFFLQYIVVIGFCWIDQLISSSCFVWSILSLISVSLSPTSRGPPRKRLHGNHCVKEKWSCWYFCIYWNHLFFFSLFTFVHHPTQFDPLIYYNLTIYIKEAVRSVECYLLYSCVFINGATNQKKNNCFYFTVSFVWRLRWYEPAFLILFLVHFYRRKREELSYLSGREGC